MQQTFVSAYRAMLAGREPRRADVWLAAIARNECLDRIRARMREPLAEPGRNGRSEAPDALSALIAGEELRTLGRSIRELPDHQRQALVLHEIHGLPYDQVAAVMGVSESAIGSLLFRARKRLRSGLDRAYGWLPLPALWDTVDHLLARAPAAKIAALPAVAKLGAGAVAVGLTAGAVVGVENEVRGPREPRSLPARVSTGPSTTRVARPPAPVLARPFRPVPGEPVRSSVPAHVRTSSPAAASHRVNRVAHVQATPPREKAAAIPPPRVEATAMLKSAAASTARAHGGPPPVSAHGRSAHPSVTGHGRAGQRARGSSGVGAHGKRAGKTSAPSASAAPASAPARGRTNSQANQGRGGAAAAESIGSQQNGNSIAAEPTAGGSPDGGASGEDHGNAFANSQSDDHGADKAAHEQQSSH
jgi:RNA polymerase sigma factor (sigma-70 family)